MKTLQARINGVLQSRPHTFPELLSLTWGIHPSDLQDALQKLEVEGKLRNANGSYELLAQRHIAQPHGNPVHPDARRHAKAERETAKFLSMLPIPHAHDFDWRFSIAGVRAFAEHVIHYHRPSDSICVVSAPTMYAYLRFLGYFDQIALVERSKDTVDTIRDFFGDAGKCQSHDLQYPWPPSFVGEFNCIVMDPPWYQDYYELFMLRAFEVLSEGGMLHTALFPPFAKTHALMERSSVISFAQNRGLLLIELKNGVLTYQAPTFELQSLGGQPQSIDQNWRRGDIASFFLGHKYGRERVYQVEAGQWREFRIEKSKLKIRRDDGRAYEGPVLNSVEQNSPFLAKINRSYKLREKIGLWTSCQQAYEVKGANVIEMMLEHLLEGPNPPTPKGELISLIAKRFGQDSGAIEGECGRCYDDLNGIIMREKEKQNGAE